jgi:hypothetical protein
VRSGGRSDTSLDARADVAVSRTLESWELRTRVSLGGQTGDPACSARAGVDADAARSNLRSGGALPWDLRSRRELVQPLPSANTRQFVLWALDLAKLPDTPRRTTAELRQTVLPADQIAMTNPCRCESHAEVRSLVHR